MRRALLAIAGFLLAAGHAGSTTLTWGAGGAGGSGTWDTSTVDWFDGTGNVAWPSEPKFASAIFGGAAGTVSISGSVAADQVTFQTGGYVIATGFFLVASSNGLAVTTNADATINASIFADTSAADVNGGTFTKLGAATLTLTNLSFFKQVNVNAGQILAPTNGGTDNARYTFLAGSGATLGLGGSTNDTFSLGALDGGGANEGVVLTDASAGKRTLSLTAYSGSYAGTLQDNGADVLAVSVGNVAQTLTAANTYTGATTLTGANGSMTLAGAGSARNTAITVKSGALVLDNSGTNLPDRISDTAPLSLAGTLTLRGGSATTTSETAGTLLTPSGLAAIVLQPDPSQATTLTLAALTGRSTTNYGLLLVQGLNPGSGPGSATIRFNSAPTLVNGLVPGALGGVSPGTTFVTYDTSGLRAYADNEYLPNSLTGGSASLVDLTGANALSGPAVIGALRLQAGALLSGSATLQIASGSVLALAGSEQITLGGLDFGVGEGIVITHGDLLLNAPVTGTGTGLGLTKAGAGSLTLAAPGSYQGLTTVTAGTLRLANAGALGATSAGTTVASGATLELAGNLAVGAEPLNLLGSGLNGAGALHLPGGTSAWSGAVAASSATVRVDSGGHLTLSGAVSGTLTRTGAGTLILTGAANTVSSTTVTAGSTIATAAADHTQGSTRYGPLGSIELDGGSVSIAPAGSGGAIALSTGGFASTTTGGIKYGGSGTLGLSRGANSSLTFTAGSLARSGLGTLILAPSTGVLGVTESLKAGGVAVANGMAIPAIVLQQSDSAHSGGFVSYGSAGFVAATPSSSTNLNTAGTTAIFAANTPQTLTGSVGILALEDNGQSITLGTNTLTLSSSSISEVGLIMNGGTITGGTLTAGSFFSGTELLAYTSLAGGTVASQITTGSLTKFGPGTLILSGAVSGSSNTRLTAGAGLAVKSGTLLLRGSVNGDVTLTADATLAGPGKITGTTSGGLISPGEGAGILTATGTGAASYAFEFNQAGLPAFGTGGASGNDVLHLTSGSAPFTSALSSSSVISLYFNQPGGVTSGEVLDGGFFADGSSDFLSSIRNATFQYYVSDPAGSVLFDGVSYRLYTDQSPIVSTMAATADFGSGPVSGFVMQITIPEPATWQLLALAALWSWRRRKR